MKKQIFIVAGTLIVVLLLAVWGYLFFFGTPESADDVFANLGLNGEVDTNYVPPPVVEEPEEPVVNMERAQLRQLTTKPIAGFREVVISTTTPPVLYYVEQGTGHVYTIDTETGEEVRISGTTVPQADKAVISADGRYVAVSSFSNTKNKPLYVGEFSTSSQGLSEAARLTVRDFALIGGTLLYTEASASGLRGAAHTLRTGAEQTLFSTPFIEARVVWGSSASSTHYIYPKASYTLEGFLYSARNGALSRLPISGYGLTANANADMVLFGRSEGQVTKSYVYNLTDETTKALDATVLPEKCLLAPTGLEFVCPFEAVKLPYEFPDEWYKGTLSFKDSLWLLNASTMTGESMVDTFAVSGREIDIIDLQVSSRGGVLYFSNKNDNTLWMYEI